MEGECVVEGRAPLDVVLVVADLVRVRVRVRARVRVRLRLRVRVRVRATRTCRRLRAATAHQAPSLRP